MNNLFLSLGVSKPTLITERTFIPHLFSSAMLSLWKAVCEPLRCLEAHVGWDRRRIQGDGRQHGAWSIEAKTQQGNMSRNQSPDKLKAREHSDAQTYTVFSRRPGGGGKRKKKQKNAAQIKFHLAVFNWSCFQCKNSFSHSTLFCLKVGRPSLRLTHLRKACDVNSEKGMHICMSFRSRAKRKCIRASSF